MTTYTAWKGERRERHLLIALFAASFVLGNAISLLILR